MISPLSPGSKSSSTIQSSRGGDTARNSLTSSTANPAQFCSCAALTMAPLRLRDRIHPASRTHIRTQTLPRFARPASRRRACNFPQSAFPSPRLQTATKVQVEPDVGALPNPPKSLASRTRGCQSAEEMLCLHSSFRWRVCSVVEGGPATFRLSLRYAFSTPLHPKCINAATREERLQVAHVYQDRAMPQFVNWQSPILPCPLQGATGNSVEVFGFARCQTARTRRQLVVLFIVFHSYLYLSAV